jgi:serine kinase of HPr protein (carbohydrate metabolism regulator)
MSDQQTIHATSVVFAGRGILIQGRSGSGKSDLALRLIDAGGSLIADDRTSLKVENGKIIASPPAALAGLIEIRGIGLRRMAHVKESRIDFCIECVQRETIPRMPENAALMLHGVALPHYPLDPFEASAVAKIRAIIHTSPAHD